MVKAEEKVQKKPVLKKDGKKVVAKKTKKSKPKPKVVKKTVKKAKNQPLSLETTINLHRVVFGCTFKRRARKAIKAIRGFVRRVMKTHDVCLFKVLSRDFFFQFSRSELIPS